MVSLCLRQERKKERVTLCLSTVFLLVCPCLLYNGMVEPHQASLSKWLLRLWCSNTSTVKTPLITYCCVLTLTSAFICQSVYSVNTSLSVFSPPLPVFLSHTWKVHTSSQRRAADMSGVPLWAVIGWAGGKVLLKSHSLIWFYYYSLLVFTTRSHIQKASDRVLLQASRL